MHLTYHILIHMLIHISYISFTHAYIYLILNLSYHVSFLIIVHIHFVSFYTLLRVLVTVYLSSHSSVMLLMSFHIMSIIIFKSFSYSYHLFLCFMHAYTLEVNTGNYKDPKVLLSLYETMNYKGPKVLLSLYETMTSIRTRRCCNNPYGDN